LGRFDVDEVKKGERAFFLFNDLILFGKPEKKKRTDDKEIVEHKYARTSFYPAIDLLLITFTGAIGGWMKWLFVRFKAPKRGHLSSCKSVTNRYS
jgi:hypothetical protein